YRELGLKMPIHSSYNLSVPVYMTVAKGLIDGVTFVDAYDPDKPQVKAFEAAYKKETGKEPFNMHGYGYDGIHLVAEAIKKAGAPDKEKIRAAMQGLSYEGVMGAKGMHYTFPEGKRTGFDPNGMVVGFREAVSVGFPPGPHPVPFPFGLGRLELGPVGGSYQSFFIIGVTLLVFVGTWLFFERTVAGKAFEAVALHRRAAALMGI